MRNGYFGILRSIAIVVVVAVAFNLLGGLILAFLYGMDIKGGSPSHYYCQLRCPARNMLVLPILMSSLRVLTSSNHSGSKA